MLLDEIRRPVIAISMWLVALPAVASGVVSVLAPLRLSDLGASALGIGATFLIAAAVEAVVSPAVGNISDRRGRMFPLRIGLAAAAIVLFCFTLSDTVVLVATVVLVIFSVGYVTYKVIEANETVKYRASYIFLDGGSLEPTQIDSLKKIIVKKASEPGASWDKLSDQYTMDGKTTHGDTGWFFGELQMPKEFQDAVKAHKMGDIFFVDVSDRNWHYIVKKTFDDDDQKDATILRANGR